VEVLRELADATFGGEIPPKARPLAQDYGVNRVNFRRATALLEQATKRNRQRQEKGLRRELFRLSIQCQHLTERLSSIARAEAAAKESDWFTGGGR
jgi:hypothetical protein